MPTASLLVGMGVALGLIAGPRAVRMEAQSSGLLIAAAKHLLKKVKDVEVQRFASLPPGTPSAVKPAHPEGLAIDEFGNVYVPT